jgi:polyisoprenoid-binding protein YceI
MTRFITTGIALIAFSALVAFSPGFGNGPQTATVIIHGSSNVHDWQSEATDVRLTGQFDTDASGKLVAVKNLAVSILVEGIKSEKGRIMDGKTYKALVSEDHPNITFQSSSVAVQGANITAKGNLNIAGETRPVTITATWNQSSGAIALSGEYAFKMTDFGIDPPTAMMGAMKTSDDVTVKYAVQWSPNP